MTETTIVIHPIDRDGLPNMEALVGRVAFIFDGCIVSGWPLLPAEHPKLYEGRDPGEVLWEGDSDVAHERLFAGVTHWVEFPVPVWDLRQPGDPQAAEPTKGMKRPKYAALTMQQQADARMNPFALQLLAEAHADDKSLFGDETIMTVARAHNGTPVFILISTRQPTQEQFEGWPT